MSVTQGVQKVLSKNIFFSYSIHRFAFSERGENKLIKFEKYDNVHSLLIINLSAAVLRTFGSSLPWIARGSRKSIVPSITFVTFY